MEAVPKLQMAFFPLKEADKGSDSRLSQFVSYLIGVKFMERPDKFADQLRQLESLRTRSCVRVGESIESVETMKRYYCQLQFIKSRFKVDKDSALKMAWKDVYTSDVVEYSDINCEQAAVLYNIGALHTKLGCQEERDTSDGMKMAVAHFQCAAWAFHTLPDLYSMIKYPELEEDLNASLLGFLSQVSLAQAQECILEKSILDARKPMIISKVCGQVVEYYKQCLRTFDTFTETNVMDSMSHVAGKFIRKNWRPLIDFKAASDSLVQAGKLNKKIDKYRKNVNDALSYCNDVINGKLEISKKENEFIYHEKVPDLESLPEVKGASLVKGIPFDMNDPDVSGPDLFDSLVSMDVHRSASLYSEEQAKLLRQVVGAIDNADAELAVFMSSMQLDDIPAPDHHAALPQELIECAAGLSVRRQAVSQLQAAMAKLASVSADVESSLSEIQAMLKEEEASEKEYQQVVGPRPATIASELEREAHKYQEAHSLASESNLTLHKAMQLHVKNLKLLARPLSDIQAEVPTFSELGDEAEARIGEMRRVLGKVDEMKSQRARLLDDLRTAVQADDITSRLAQTTGGEEGEAAGELTEALFRQELKKHEPLVAVIKQNLAAQANILGALTEKNAEYVDTRQKVAGVIRRREEIIGSLVASYYAYEDLLGKTTKGLEFYDKLEGNVSKLLARVSGVVKVQQEERFAVMENSAKRAEEARALSLSLISGGGSLPAGGGGAGTLAGFRPDFTPGAPPPDTPDQLMPAFPSASVAPAAALPAATAAPSAGRPKLGDYLKARKEGLDHKAAASKTHQDEKIPSVRPQPVGSESDPPSVHPTSLGYPGYPGYSSIGGPAAAPPSSMPAGPRVPPPASASQVGGFPTPMSSHAPLHLPGSISSTIPPASQYQQQLGAYQPSAHPQPIPAGIHHSQAAAVPYGQQQQPQQLQYPLPTAAPASGAVQWQQQGQMPPGMANPAYRPPVGHSVANQRMEYHQPVQPRLTTPSQVNQQAGNSHHQPMYHTGQQLPSAGYGLATPAGFGISPQDAASQNNYQNRPSNVNNFAENSAAQTISAPSPASTQAAAMPSGNVAAGQLHPHTSHYQQPGQPYQYPMTGGHTASYPAVSAPSNMGNLSGNAAYGGVAPQSRSGAPGNIAVSGVHSQSQPVATTGQSHASSNVSTAGVLPTNPALGYLGMQNAVAGVPNLTPNLAGAPSYAVQGQSNAGTLHTGAVAQNTSAVSAQNLAATSTSAFPTVTSVGGGQYAAARVPGSFASTTNGSAGLQSQTNSPAYQQPGLQGVVSSYNTGGVVQQPNSMASGLAAQSSSMARHGQQQYVPFNYPPSAGQPAVAPQNSTVVTAGHNISLAQARPTAQPLPGQVSQPSAGGAPTNLDLLAGLDIKPAPVSQPSDSLSGLDFSAPKPAAVPVVPMPGTVKPMEQPATSSIRADQEVKEQQQHHQAPAMSEEEWNRLLSAETERLSQFMATLTSHTLSGPTPLEVKWKEAVNIAAAANKNSVSVARCCPMKNRVPDVLPYDQTRVELKLKDDYINASFVRDLGNDCPGIIVTQAPLPATVVDFWSAVWQENVETVVCLVPESELGPRPYIPLNKGQLEAGHFVVHTQNVRPASHCTERVINITNGQAKQTRAVMHVTLSTGWPGPDMPVSPAPLVDCAAALHSLHRQQRSAAHPVLVHCLDGGNKSGTFCAVLAVLAGMQRKDNPAGWQDMVKVVAGLMGQRKGVLRDKQFMKLAYEVVLYFMQDSLMRSGILSTAAACAMGQQKKGHSRHPSQDFVLGSAAASTGLDSINVKESFAAAARAQEVEVAAPPLPPAFTDTAATPVPACSSSSDVEPSPLATTTTTDSQKPATVDQKLPAANLLDDLTGLADIKLTDSPSRRKITKEDFLKPAGASLQPNDSADPLSQLDPLWSLK